MKRNIIAITLLLVSFLVIKTPAYAEFEFGVEGLSQNDEYTLDTVQANWWFQRNLALRGDFSWNDQNLGLGIIYQLKPDNTISPYLGIMEYGLSGKNMPETAWDQKMLIITGMKLSLNKLKKGLSIALEAKINPNELSAKNNSNNNFSGWGISLNYSLPEVTKNHSKEPGFNFDKKTVYLLGKLITMEANGEPFEGQVAVGAVVLNRVKSPEFPNSILKVIYQPGQFTTAGKLKKIIPKDSALKAAKAALNGEDPSRGALYFYNPVTCSDKSRQYIKKSNFQVTTRIGRHVFYK